MQNQIKFFLNIQTTALFKIDQNTEKSPEDLRRLAVTLIPVENHELMLEWKKKSQRSKVIIEAILSKSFANLKLYMHVCNNYQTFVDISYWPNC